MMNLQEIYLALFGRPADPAGLAYWEEQIAAGALSPDMAARMSDSAEYDAAYRGLSPDAIVRTLFVNLFGRDIDQAGLILHAAELAAGLVTPAAVALRLAALAEGPDRAMLSEKLAAADLYTGRFDTDVEIAAYHGGDAAAAARLFLSSVTPESPATAEAVDRAILALVEAGGGAQWPGEGGGDEEPLRLDAAITPHRLEDGEKLLLIGEGSAEGFAIAAGHGLELGISLRDGDGEPLPSAGYRDGTAIAGFDAVPADASLLLSVASLSQHALGEFTLRLSIDTDPTAAVAFRHYLLQGDAGEGYLWALDDNGDGIANGAGDRVHDTLAIDGGQGYFMLLDRLALPNGEGLFDIRLGALDADYALAETAIRLDLVGTDPHPFSW